MPIHECDPWREQYFQDVDCPPEVHIPTDDVDAFRLYREHRWIYDKLAVARSQGIACGPHGHAPQSYPVFCKPVINLKGMGIGSGILADARDYEVHCGPGDFWMALLTGEHISSDWAVESGEPVWCRHTLGVPLGAGMFDHWVIQARRRPELERYCGEWIRRHLGGFTGMINVETIGGRIIEVHLRFSDQWPDLYGAGWLQAVVRLYAEGRWVYEEGDRHDGFSVVLFGPHGVAYRHPPAAVLAEYRAIAGVTSIQITFLEDRAPQAHSMPPGGFRLAIVNCTRLAVGMAVRAAMADDFGLLSQSAGERRAL